MTPGPWVHLAGGQQMLQLLSRLCLGWRRRAILHATCCPSELQLPTTPYWPAQPTQRLGELHSRRQPGTAAKDGNEQPFYITVLLIHHRSCELWCSSVRVSTERLICQ